MMKSVPVPPYSPTHDIPTEIESIKSAINSGNDDDESPNEEELD